MLMAGANWEHDPPGQGNRCDYISDLTLPDLAGPGGQADWRSILARTLPYVDLFLPSVEELIFMLRPERFEELTARTGAADLLQALTGEEIVSLAREALSMGARIVLLKLGTSGAYLRTGTELSGLGRGAPAGLLMEQSPIVGALLQAKYHHLDGGHRRRCHCGLSGGSVAWRVTLPGAECCGRRGGVLRGGGGRAERSEKLG